jgi:hypothetical protein
MRWSVDDRVFYDAVTPWTLPETGTGYVSRLSSPTAIPDGRYQMELLMNGILLQSISVEIGIGQLPLDVFRNAEGVLLRGRVIDGDTRLGIPDVTIFILSEQFSVVDFTNLAEQVYASTVSDRNGQFQFSQLLVYWACRTASLGRPMVTCPLRPTVLKWTKILKIRWNVTFI